MKFQASVFCGFACTTRLMGTFGSHHLSPGKMMLGSFLTKKDGFQWLPKADSAPSPDCPFLSLMLCKDNVLRVIAVPHVATSGSFYLSSTLIPPPGGGSTEENRKGGEGRLLADSGARSLPAGVLRPCPPAGSGAARAQGQPSVCVGGSAALENLAAPRGADRRRLSLAWQWARWDTGVLPPRPPSCCSQDEVGPHEVP